MVAIWMDVGDVTCSCGMEWEGPEVRDESEQKHSVG